MKTKLVSIIIPTRNRALLLRRAINSILKQTFQDFEVIVVDDSSTDNTKEIIKFKDKRIRYFLKKRKPHNPASTRNDGIKKAKGEYVAFLDDDDEWLPEKLEKQMKVFSGNKNIIVVHSNYYLIKDDGVFKKGYKLKLEGNVSLKDFVYKGITPSTAIIKKKYLKKELFDENLNCAEDRELFIRISKYGEIAFCSEFLVNVYKHKKNTTLNLKNKIESEEYFIKKYLKELTEQKLLWIYFYRLGSLNISNKEFKKARTYFSRTIKLRPLFFRAYPYYVFAASLKIRK